MPKKNKSRTHHVVIKVVTNRPITRAQAAFTVWNAIGDLTIYGFGKEDPEQPFDTGHIRVRKRGGTV